MVSVDGLTSVFLVSVDGLTSVFLVSVDGLDLVSLDGLGNSNPFLLIIVLIEWQTLIPLISGLFIWITSIFPLETDLPIRSYNGSQDV